MTDLEGSFTSPNHPGSYPPNLLCMWVIQVPPPFIVQIHVLSLAVEGPSPCLFDWLEVQEQLELRSVVTRSVVMPPWRSRGALVALSWHFQRSFSMPGSHTYVFVVFK